MKFYIALFLATFFGACHANDSTSILNYIEENLPQCGAIRQTDFVYVDVDDAYIHNLLPFIEKERFIEPPYFNDDVGAHITVIYPEEMKKYGIGCIEECGEIITFTPKECQIVNPPKWKEIDQVYFVVVTAPRLDEIRKKYGLPKREYDFHITLGVKPKCVKAA